MSKVCIEIELCVVYFFHVGDLVSGGHSKINLVTCGVNLRLKALPDWEFSLKTGVLQHTPSQLYILRFEEKVSFTKLVK